MHAYDTHMRGTLCAHLSDWERGGHQSLTQAKGPTRGQKKGRMPSADT